MYYIYIFPPITIISLQETVQVQTMMRGKLRESDPVPVDIPMTLPEDLLRYLFCDVGLEIPPCEIQKYWKHCRDTNCPWSCMSEGDHIPCALYGDSAKFSLAGEKVTCIFFQLTPLESTCSSSSDLAAVCNGNFSHAGGPNPFPNLQEDCSKYVATLWAWNSGWWKNSSFLRHRAEGRLGMALWCPVFKTIMEEFAILLAVCEASKTAESDGFPSYLDFREHPDWEAAQLTHAQFLARCISIGPAGPCELAST